MCVCTQHLDVAQLLINHHSEVNAVDRWRFTPLHEAAQKGRTQLCSLLVMNGADVCMKNQDGHTALDIASVGVMGRECAVGCDGRRVCCGV